MTEDEAQQQIEEHTRKVELFRGKLRANGYEPMETIYRLIWLDAYDVMVAALKPLGLSVEEIDDETFTGLLEAIKDGFDNLPWQPAGAAMANDYLNRSDLLPKETDDDPTVEYATQRVE